MKREKKDLSRTFKKGVGRIRKGAGFTLIELMVVIVIIGILASVALPKFIVNQKKAKEGSAWADLDSMTTACEMFYLDMDQYPEGTGSRDDTGASLADLVVDPGITGKVWGGPYMKYRKVSNDIPQDPWGNPYAYDAATGTSGEAQTYTIWCQGATAASYSAIYINSGDFKSP